MSMLTVWTGGTTQLSEWTVVMVAGYGVFSEIWVNVALPLDTQQRQWCNIAELRATVRALKTFALA